MRTALLNVLISTLIFFTGATNAQSLAPVRHQQLLKDINFIASDYTEGRFTASPGYNKAAAYVVNEFKKAGLQPGWILVNGEKTFLQPVPFVRKNYGRKTIITLVAGGIQQQFRHDSADFVVIHPGKGNDAEPSSPVFVGFGIEEPGKGWDDFQGMNLTGRWVIEMPGTPVTDSAYPASQKWSQNAAAAYGNGRNADSLKIAALMRHHAAGVMLLPDQRQGRNWETTVIRCYRFRYMQYADSNISDAKDTAGMASLLIGPLLAHRLFAGRDFDPLNNKGRYHSFLLSGIKIAVHIEERTEKASGYNIVARCPGTDPALSGEVLTVGAHLDHIGRIGKHIYNGANDDASGCVAVLGAARAFAKHHEKRPVLFVCYTGEELNLIGSGHFLRHPPVPLKNILLNINLEQVGSIHRDYPGIWAIGDKSLEMAFRKSRHRFNSDQLKYDSLKGMEEVMSNCDSWPFLQHRIPSIILGSGGFPEQHSTEDKISLIDFDHLQKSTELLSGMVSRLAAEGIRKSNRE